MHRLWAVLALSAIAALAQPPLRPPAPGARGAKLEGPLVRIPSKFAGTEGVWVRVAPPERPRYAEGAPVVVHVPGGLGPGGVGTAAARLGDFGFIDIVFLFPGGESGPPVDGKPLRSGGVYDSRGPASVRALADVILFSMGRLKSTEGKTIQDYAGRTRVLTDQVGVIGWSLGGTTIAAALGMHGKELRGVKWYASHESPYGEGVIDGEFGTHGRPSKFYDASTGNLDLSGLKYSKDMPVTLMGRPLPGAGDLRGGLYLDGDGNGVYQEGPDFGFSGMFLAGPPPNVFYAPFLTKAAAEKKVFGSQWPAHIATLKQTEEPWRIRDGVSNIASAVKNLPELAVIVFAGAVDHVQATADHRHILLQYGGFQQAGARWVRLNPDPSYVDLVLGRKPAGAPRNPAGAKFDRQSIRQAVMPEPPDGPSDQEALTAAACELAGRTKKGEWRPALDDVLFADAPRGTPARRPGPGATGAAARQPRIAVVFNIHLDPVSGPNLEARRQEQERRRENVLWLQKTIEAIDGARRPKLNIQMGGDHAEFFLNDERGFEMMRRFYTQGHGVGTHFHLNTYSGQYLDWPQLRPSMPFQKPQPAPGEIMTPGAFPEPNNMEEIRRLWSDNFRFTGALISKLSGVTDKSQLRGINNNGEFFLPGRMEGKEVLFKEYGITVQTGGRNELFNMIFDHDVHNAWRPGTRQELDEDVNNRAYVCVPQLAVPGNIKPHQGVLQDLSIPATQRRFLQIVMERREHERLGLPPKAWTFGWTVHDFDISPPESLRGPNLSQRKNIEELVRWINGNFVSELAYWDTPNGVAKVFQEIETRQAGAPQFRYSLRNRDWDAYPYRLKGVAQALAGSHYVRTAADWRAQRVQAFEHARAKTGSEWYTERDATVKLRGETTRLLVAWSEAGLRTLDLSGQVSGEVKVIRGGSGEASKARAAAVAVGEEPVIVEIE